MVTRDANGGPAGRGAEPAEPPTTGADRGIDNPSVAHQEHTEWPDTTQGDPEDVVAAWCAQHRTWSPALTRFNTLRKDDTR